MRNYTTYYGKYLLQLLSLLLITNILRANNKHKIDSLFTVMKNSNTDTVKINAHIQIANYLMRDDTVAGYTEIRKIIYKLKEVSNKDYSYKILEKIGRVCYYGGSVYKAKLHFGEALAKAKKEKENNWAAVFYFRIAEMLQREDYSRQCIAYFDSALQHIDKTNEILLTKIHQLKGRAHYDSGDYKTAMEQYIVAQKLYEKNNRLNTDYGNLLHFIGSVFKRQNQLDKALEYYAAELELARKINNKSLEAEALYLCAGIYGTRGDIDKELSYELEALKIYKDEKNDRSVAMILGNISYNYADRKDYKKAIQYCEEALEIYKYLHQEDQESWVYMSLGDYHSRLGQYKKALEYLNHALELSKKVETKQLLHQTDITQSIAYAYAGMGNYREAFENYVRYKELEDSLNSQENMMYLNDLEKKYGTEKKEKEIALLNKDKQVQQTELDKQKTKQNALLTGSLLILIIAGISVFAFITNRKKSRLLSKQVSEINYKNSIIKEKNKDITDSIVYAKRLQEAVFPSTNELNNYFAESFVLFRPKDIVSGDFYWFEQIDNKVVFIVGDSTGHGVPGAFMSKLGHNLLNQIILEEKTTNPAEILTVLDKRVTNALNKKGSKQEYNDGMDIGICVLDKTTHTLSFAGANRPLIIKRGEQIIELKQNKFAIGGIHFEKSKTFTQHEINVLENDVMYLFSDGYYDQFGGPKGKKFKLKQLNELIIKNAHKPLSEQLNILNESFEKWKGDLEQIDDVCVIGIKV